jgi:hypothetical protein
LRPGLTIGSQTVANPTIVSYNASAVKIYNATSRLVRFGNKKIYKFEKRSTQLEVWKCVFTSEKNIFILQRAKLLVAL